MRNSNFYLAIFIFCLINSGSVIAGDLKQSNTSILIEVAHALGELGDSVIKLTDGVKRQATGSNTVDNLFVNKTKNMLTDLTIRSAQFRTSKNTIAVGIMNNYLLDPRPSVWYESKMNLGIIIKSGFNLLQEWEAKHSHVVPEESYRQLLSTLSERINILKKLEKMAPPQSQEELTALNQVNKNIGKLVTQFDAAILNLNTYVEKNET